MKYAAATNKRRIVQSLYGLVTWVRTTRLLVLTLVLVELMFGITVSPLRARLATARTIVASWSYTGNLSAVRAGHTATLLQNGIVLIAGGFGNNGISLNTAELYEPATGAWSSTGNLHSPRGNHTATLLPNGKVLVVGGHSVTGAGPLESAELYDPATGIWSSTDNLNAARGEHTATLLPNAKVLVVGGLYAFNTARESVSLNSAELYDQGTGLWSNTGSLNSARGDHTATLLLNGKVLVVGGGPGADNPLNSAELYDSDTGTWSTTGILETARLCHTATLLPRGKVLVAGGRNFDVDPGGGSLNSAELYDPVTGLWSGVPNFSVARLCHTATLLPNGKVVIAGGRNFSFKPNTLNSTEVFDSVTSSWSITANLNTGRISTASLLLNGKILVAGGLDDSSYLDTAELFDLGTNTVSKPVSDFDGDGRSDISVFRPSDGVWYLHQSTAGFTGVPFGLSTDTLAPADYDGDGKTDVAVCSSGTWYLLRSTLGFTAIAFGNPSDSPQPADFDGDGQAEIVVYRPSSGTWYVLNLVNNQFNAFQFGASTDQPVVGDYDGDDKADYAVYRDGIWFLQRSQLGFTSIAFGIATDKPTIGDYDGDGKTDIAVYRPSSGTWYLQQSAAGFRATQFGISTDLPVPADYDGDGKTDIAVFRDGTWYLLRSTQGFAVVNFGLPNDKPIPNAFVP